MNIQDWFPLGWTSWISLQSKGLSRVFSNTTVQKHQFFSTQWLLSSISPHQPLFPILLSSPLTLKPTLYPTKMNLLLFFSQWGSLVSPNYAFGHSLNVFFDLILEGEAWKLRAQMTKSTECFWFPHSMDTCKFLLQTWPPYLSKYLACCVSHTRPRWLPGPELCRCLCFLGENARWSQKLRKTDYPSYCLQEVCIEITVNLVTKTLSLNLETGLW